MTRVETPFPVEVFWRDAAEEQGTLDLDVEPGLEFCFVGYLVGYTEHYATFASHICTTTDEQQNRFDILWSMIERMNSLRTGTTIFKEGKDLWSNSKAVRGARK
jgi:hypothetical protein